MAFSLYNDCMETSVGTTRHSFRHSNLMQAIDMSKNEFGQTVLSDEDAAISGKVEPYVDKELGLVVKGDIFNSPILQKFAHEKGFNPADYHGTAEESTENIDQYIVQGDQDTDDSLSQLLDSEEINEFKRILNQIKEQTVVVSEAPVEPKETKETKFIKRTASLEESPANARPKSSMTQCVHSDCGALLVSGSKFCSECGKPQLSRHCTGCGHRFDSVEKFCPDCGVRR